MTQITAINQHNRKRDQERDKVYAVVGPNTVHQPDTMVIMSRDTGLTEAAMLAAGWLEEITCGTTMAWVKQDPVVWVSPHFLLVILRCDE